MKGIIKMANKSRGSTNNRDSFLREIMSLSHYELNAYIKAHGKPPKPVRMYHLVDKSVMSYEQAKVIHLSNSEVDKNV